MWKGLGVHQERQHVYYVCKTDYVATRHATGYYLQLSVSGRGGGMTMYGIADGPHGGGVDSTILSIKTPPKHMVLTE